MEQPDSVVNYAVPHSFVVEGKKIYLRYIETNLDDPSQILRYVPQTGLVSKGYQTPNP